MRKAWAIFLAASLAVMLGSAGSAAPEGGLPARRPPNFLAAFFQPLGEWVSKVGRFATMPSRPEIYGTQRGPEKGWPY